MTRREFDALIDEAEKISGRTFDQAWRDERFKVAQHVTAQSFREELLPTSLTSKGIVELKHDHANN